MTTAYVVTAGYLSSYHIVAVFVDTPDCLYARGRAERLRDAINLTVQPEGHMIARVEEYAVNLDAPKNGDRIWCVDMDKLGHVRRVAWISNEHQCCFLTAVHWSTVDRVVVMTATVWGANYEEAVYHANKKRVQLIDCDKWGES